MPLKDSALPYLPVVAQVAFTIVPVLLLPEASATVEPAPSLKPYAAARPVPGGGGAAWVVSVQVTGAARAIPSAPLIVVSTRAV